jgi:hypothetical protein
MNTKRNLNNKGYIISLATIGAIQTLNLILKETKRLAINEKDYEKRRRYF